MRGWCRLVEIRDFGLLKCPISGSQESSKSHIKQQRNIDDFQKRAVFGIWVSYCWSFRIPRPTTFWMSKTLFFNGINDHINWWFYAGFLVAINVVSSTNPPQEPTFQVGHEKLPTLDPSSNSRLFRMSWWWELCLRSVGRCWSFLAQKTSPMALVVGSSYFHVDWNVLKKIEWRIKWGGSIDSCLRSIFVGWLFWIDVWTGSDIMSRKGHRRKLTPFCTKDTSMIFGCSESPLKLWRDFRCFPWG